MGFRGRRARAEKSPRFRSFLKPRASVSIRPAVINFALSRTTIFTLPDRESRIYRGAYRHYVCRRTPTHPRARGATRAHTSACAVDSARVRSANRHGCASPLENCPPYFYHITSFLSHLPLSGPAATTITAAASSHPSSFPSRRDFQRSSSLFLSSSHSRSSFSLCLRSPSRPNITLSLLLSSSSSSLRRDREWLTAETQSPPFYLRIIRVRCREPHLCHCLAIRPFSSLSFVSEALPLPSFSPFRENRSYSLDTLTVARKLARMHAGIRDLSATRSAGTA